MFRLEHGESPKPFQSTGKGGGKREKEQHIWPWAMKIVAEAINHNYSGSPEAFMKNKDHIKPKDLGEVMDKMMPGWRELRLSQFKKPPKTKLEVLLQNRVYKMYYHGSSNGNMGKPVMTIGKEHWSVHNHGEFANPNHPLNKLHLRALRCQGVEIKNWRDYL